MTSNAQVWNPQDPIPKVTTDSTMITEVYAATAGQVEFKLTQFTYVPAAGALQVFKNGKILRPVVDWVEQDGTKFSLTSSATLADEVIAVGFVGVVSGIPSDNYATMAATADLSVADASALRAITPVEGMIRTVRSSDGGKFIAKTGASAGTYTDNGGVYAGTQIIPAGGDGSSGWVRDYDGYRVYSSWFGCTFDTTTDNTGLFNAALATKRDLFIEDVDDPTTQYYKLTSSLNFVVDSQRILGNGFRALLKQTSSLERTVYGNNLKYIEVRGVHVYAGGGYTSITNGNGMFFNNCTRVKVSHCFVEGHRGNGIHLVNSNRCDIGHNYLFNSPVADTDAGNQASGDITLHYSCNKNTIHHNYCVSGQANGITNQSITAGDSALRNKILDNYIEDARSYGILNYRNSVSSTIAYTEISRNPEAFPRRFS